VINETVILLIPLGDYSKHKLSKYIPTYLGDGYPFNQYYYEPIQNIFSKVIVYDYIKRMTEINVKFVNKEIIDLVKKEKPKYVIWVSLLYEFLESTSDIIRKEGTKVIGIFFDDEWRFNEYSKWWIPHLDYCITNDFESVQKYKKLGARVFHTVPCNGIPIDRDWTSIVEKYNVSFVGAKKFDREQYINRVKEKEIPINLFGRGWGNYVSFEEMIDIFKTSKINLNFSKTNYDKMGWKGRVFQICLAGGFLLTEYCPGIEKYFKINKEIVCFHNAEEMIDKITYYLNHKEERQTIAKAGWKRAINEYTPFHMMFRIFKNIEEDMKKNKKNNFCSQDQILTSMMYKKFSNYYLNWAIALSLENYKDLWKDALSLSISYNLFNIKAWCYYLIGFSPSFVRIGILKLYRIIKKLYRVFLKIFFNRN